MIKPPRLSRGSTIAVLSPSWGGPSLFPDIYQKGLQNLRELFGFNIIEYSTACMEADKLYRNPRLRAHDINEAFVNPEVDAIIATIGGFESIRILPYLDVDTILANPKIIMGYSDTTTILTYLNYRGLVTFHGPAIMAGWAQVENFPYLQSYYMSMLMESHEWMEVQPFPTWSNGYPDWGNPETIGEVLHLQANEVGFEWIQGTRPVSGRLWGGCVEIIPFLNGTAFWPNTSFWKDRVLMIETSEEKPTPQQVGYVVRNLGIQGILDQLSGMLIGRPKDYSREEQQDLHAVVKAIVGEEFENTDMVIVGNMDFGHTDPNLILPLGIEVELDPVAKRIRLAELVFAN